MIRLHSVAVREENPHSIYFRCHTSDELKELTAWIQEHLEPGHTMQPPFSYTPSRFYDDEEPCIMLTVLTTSKDDVMLARLSWPS